MLGTGGKRGDKGGLGCGVGGREKGTSDRCLEATRIGGAKRRLMTTLSSGVRRDTVGRPPITTPGSSRSSQIALRLPKSYMGSLPSLARDLVSNSISCLACALAIAPLVALALRHSTPKINPKEMIKAATERAKKTISADRPATAWGMPFITLRTNKIAETSRIEPEARAERLSVDSEVSSWLAQSRWRCSSRDGLLSGLCTGPSALEGLKAGSGVGAR